MKRLVFCIPIFVILSCLIACNKKTEEKEKKFLSNCIERLDITDNYQWIVILPGTGCHGCIQDGEFFMKKNIGNNKVLFILTKISSLKILQQKLGLQIKDHSNIYIDKENIFDIPSNNSIYPCVIKLEKGKILTYAFQSPRNNAFHLLK